jgi:hypothetical protein
MFIESNPKEEELCLVDSCTTNSILRDREREREKILDP